MIPFRTRETRYGYRLDPLPSPDELRDLYERSSFYTTLKPAYFREREEDAFWWRETYRFTLSTLGAPLSAFENALDFGCGPGYLARFLIDNGVGAVVGYDPSRVAREYAERELKIRAVGTIDETIAGGPYDLIVCWEVLEHLRDPDSAAILFRELLTANGRIVIVVPNDFNPLQRRVKDLFGSYWLDRTHLHYFSHAGLRALLEENGFDVIEQIATFPMEIFLFLGLNYVGNRRLGRLCHGFRKKFEAWISDEERERLYTLFELMNWGRESVIVARRKQRLFEEGEV